MAECFAGPVHSSLITDHSGKLTPMPRRFPFSLRKPILAAAIVAALTLGWFAAFRLPLAIRQPATIAGMTAVLYRRAPDLPQIEEFDVSKSHFDAILRPLLNARVDYFPAKWQVFGELCITSNDNSETTIHLYLTRAGTPEPGLAFSCGGIYYLGGSALEVEQAVIAAKAESER